jgi:hypothetical protein
MCKKLGFICGFDGVMGGELEPLTQLMNRETSNRGRMQIEPGSNLFYPVGRCVDFLNLFNVTFFSVGQGKYLICKASRTTSLSAIFFPICLSQI